MRPSIKLFVTVVIWSAIKANSSDVMPLVK